MNYIGLDIGTTSISSVVIDIASQTLLTSKTIANDGRITSLDTAAHLQDPDVIMDSVLHVLKELLERYPDVAGIGITGQMHGILYTDHNGKAVSPLYTWQDEQGNLLMNEKCTYAETLSSLTGYPLATGFGLVTHYVLSQRNQIPQNSVSFCTVPDYLAMKLTHNSRPILHPTMAASLGCFDLQNRCFDIPALSKAFSDLKHLPEISSMECAIGKTQDGIPVFPAIGDNQASFLGAVSSDDSLLVNVGTGSQISVLVREYNEQSIMECRPYIQNQYLLVHSPLCGGYSYSLLHQFLAETAKMIGAQVPDDLYSRMNQAAAGISSDELTITNHFLGTRANPALKGKIEGLTPSNFTPAHITRGILAGICQELYGCYEQLPETLKTAATLTGSGNGLRRNPLLQEIFEKTFGMPLYLSAFEEEAACGAAIFASLS